MSQITNHILMVRPANFGFNEQTAQSNAFQTNDKSISQKEISQRAIAEFDAMVELLREKGMNVIVAEDSAEPIKYDAIFPNNWVTFHDDGKVVLYPMYAPMRRLERQEHILDQVRQKFNIETIYHLEKSEAEDLFLEGTGSMILDRPNRIVYACLSPRTDKVILNRFCHVNQYKKILFTSIDEKGQKIYHTNVMMALGDTFCVIGLDTVPDVSDRAYIVGSLETTGREIIDLSAGQINSFAGNMLQVKNAEGKTFLAMSEQAHKSLTKSQIDQIEKHTTILAIPIPTIEKYGGGSVRCMMAEIFLKEK
jgi:hypothetical protein